MGGWAREAQGAESQKVSGIKERKISSVVWDRDDDDRRWGCQRKSPPPTPDLLLYLKFKELASPIMGRGGGGGEGRAGARQWTWSLLDMPGGEGCIGVMFLGPLPDTLLHSLLRGFRAAGWRDIRGEGDMGTAWGFCTYGL